MYTVQTTLVTLKKIELIIFLQKQDEISEACLQQVHFFHLNDVYHLMEILWRCTSQTNHYKLIIIDSLATLFSPLIGDFHNDSNAPFFIFIFFFQNYLLILAFIFSIQLLAC